MKSVWLFFCLMLTVTVAGISAEDPPDEALCPVCAVHGETEMESVKAHADYGDTTYFFCSEKCRSAFLEDPVAYAPPTLPRPAPAFVVETLDGRDMAMDDLRGKVVLVDFWATWCKPCEKIMPEVQRLYEQYASRGFTVAGVSIDQGEDRADKVKKFLKKLDVSYPTFLDAKKSPAWYAYRVKAVPAMFLIDREGRIVAQWLGTVDHERIEEVVSRLLSESPDPDRVTAPGQ